MGACVLRYKRAEPSLGSTKVVYLGWQRRILTEVCSLAWCVCICMWRRWLIREWSATCAPSRIYCRRWYCETDIISAFNTVTTPHALTTLAGNFKRWRFPRLAVKQLAPSTYNWRKTLAMYFTGQVLSIISFSFFIPGAARSSALYSAIFSRARSVVESGI